MDNIIDIFNEKMNISKNTTDIKGLEIMMNNISLNNIYIYIYILIKYMFTKRI